MPKMFDYLKWRGDLPFSQAPVNPVDALIFSSLCYTEFGDIVTDDPIRPVFFKDAVDHFFSLPDHEKRVRVKKDLELLLEAAESPRFRNVGLCFYRDEMIEEEESQFAAMTFLLDDGSAFLSYRGTDYTLVGWKEDFNMSFQDTVPAQRKAAEYLTEFAGVFSGPMHLGGHSKGGNLAVFAAAEADTGIQARIRRVYNLDGPGFGSYLMGTEGYLSIVPKIETYIPQSSIIGMLLEHEEPYTVIKATQVGIMQHDPYSWELLGGNFIQAEDLSPDNKFMDKTLKHWLSGMTMEQRNEFVDTIFSLLGQGGAKKVYHLLHPQSISTLLKTLSTDANVRSILNSELTNLIEAAKATQEQLSNSQEELPE